MWWCGSMSAIEIFLSLILSTGWEEIFVIKLTFAKIRKHFGCPADSNMGSPHSLLSITQRIMEKGTG
jgi:hypothetical protein